MTPMGLGPFIKERRPRLGWTQAELGERLNLDRAYIAQIETGKIRWPRDVVPDLADALGLSQVDMAVAAGLIDPPTTNVTPSPLADPVVRQIVEELAHLSDRDKQHVLVVVKHLLGGEHGATARRPAQPRSGPDTDAGHADGIRRTG